MSSGQLAFDNEPDSVPLRRVDENTPGVVAPLDDTDPAEVDAAAMGLYDAWPDAPVPTGAEARSAQARMNDYLRKRAIERAVSPAATTAGLGKEIGEDLEALAQAVPDLAAEIAAIGVDPRVAEERRKRILGNAVEKAVDREFGELLVELPLTIKNLPGHGNPQFVSPVRGKLMVLYCALRDYLGVDKQIPVGREL